MSRPSIVDPSTLPVRNSSGYPEPYRSRCLPREKRALGDPFGLTKVGINLTTLAPGRESSMRHWHTREDEFIYVVEGEVVLRNDSGEHVLRAGMCAGFSAGSRDGHQLINKSSAPVRYLEVSNRDPEDSAEYSDPDVDLAYHKGADGKNVFTRRDGTPY
jgi:uncharacterized cupin superfamily protein